MKRRIAAALAAATALAGVTQAALAQRSAAPPTLKPGELTIAYGGEAPGFADGTIKGSQFINPRGYEVDLGKALAAQLGLKKVNFTYTPWAGLFKPGPKSFDLSFQEATITSARAQHVTFSTPYLNANQGVLIRKGIAAPKSLADLKKLQTCAQTDTTGLDFIQTRLHPSKQPRIYQQTAQAFAAVQVGQCDALILDVPIVELQRKAKPAAYGPVAGQILTHEQYGAVMQKGSKLAPFVNRAIRQLTANGTIARLQKHWFTISFNKVPVLK